MYQRCDVRPRLLHRLVELDFTAQPHTMDIKVSLTRLLVSYGLDVAAGLL